jgi:peptidoglycan hydrolase-like protein with peptidoglycan-binding domain
LTFDSDAASSSFRAVYLNRHRVLKAKSSRDFKIKEDKPLRVFILVLSIFAILVSANVAKAGPSTTDRGLLASADPATLADEATQQTEDQIGLDKRKRRDVQRRLTGLGFDTKVNGRFDKSTRAVITRWQAARGYPKTGFFNTLQHQALQTESASSARASLGSGDKFDDDRPARRRGGSHHRSGGGPGGLFGGVVGGLFGRR